MLLRDAYLCMRSCRRCRKSSLFWSIVCSAATGKALHQCSSMNRSIASCSLARYHLRHVRPTTAYSIPCTCSVLPASCICSCQKTAGPAARDIKEGASRQCVHCTPLSTMSWRLVRPNLRRSRTVTWSSAVRSGCLNVLACCMAALCLRTCIVSSIQSC